MTLKRLVAYHAELCRRWKEWGANKEQIDAVWARIKEMQKEKRCKTKLPPCSNDR